MDEKIKELQEFLVKKGYDLKVDGINGPQTQAALDVYTKSVKGKTKDSILGSISRDISKTLGIPLNARQFIYDLSGGKNTISEKDLTTDELNALRQVVRNNLSKGKKFIEYQDYDIASTDLQDKSNTTTSTINQSLTNPTYNLRSTLGQAKINVIGKDTIVTDTYDFNDAPKDRGSFAEKVYGAITNPSQQKDSGSLYSTMRTIGKWFGSSPQEGGGSESIINTSQVPKVQKDIDWNSPINKLENGGELQGQQIGSALGSLSNLAIPGLGAVLSPLLGQIGSQIGAKKDMTKVLQDHYNSLSQSTNPYGNYENGGALTGALNSALYRGDDHDAPSGGITVNSDGVPSEGGTNKVEGGEMVVKLKGKSIVFSKKLKI